jgi:hypothetical protein
VVRQFSLLRTAMRADIALYTTPWGSPLTEDDVAFLLACGVDVGREPWRRSALAADEIHEHTPWSR